MKKVLVILIGLIVLSCNPGDIDLEEFNFSDVKIDNCGDLVLYKVKDNEALFIELDGTDSEDFFITEMKYELNKTGNKTITYRTFDETLNGSNYFCQSIPPTSPTTINEWIGTGDLNVEPTLLSEDDNDGVPVEDEDINGDGNYANDNSDSEVDDIPDYIDLDDDGDGIPTLEEDVDGDGDPANDDTDGDFIPNYLDKDDDGDGVDTKYESKEDQDEDTIPDYLDIDPSTPLEEARTVTNKYTVTYGTTLTIEFLRLENTKGEILQYDIFDFGEKEVTKSIEE